MSEHRFSGRRKDGKKSSVECLAYRFRGYPDEDTQSALWNNINGCRGFWNLLVSDSEYHYREFGGPALLNTPADYKGADEYSWLCGIDSLALCNVQRHFESAMSAFFCKDAARPKRKRKKRCRSSYTTSLSNRAAPNLYLKGDMLKLPRIKSPIRLNLHRRIREGGLLKQCTVCCEADGWYFSLLYEYPKQETAVILQPDPSHIGLDMSLPELYVDSNGCTPDFPRPFRRSEEKLARLQKKASRMLRANTIGYETRNGYRVPVYRRPLDECRNIQKQFHRIALLHARIKHQRADFLHKLSCSLTGRYGLISIEDLDMRAIKKGLRFGKSAGDIGWGEFTRMLSYKQERKGHVLVKVNKWFPSSRTCSCCGYVSRELKLSDRIYVCPECGNIMDRDHQAAVNIDREGLRIYREKLSY